GPSQHSLAHRWIANAGENPADRLHRHDLVRDVVERVVTVHASLAEYRASFLSLRGNDGWFHVQYHPRRTTRSPRKRLKRGLFRVSEADAAPPHRVRTGTVTAVLFVRTWLPDRPPGPVIAPRCASAWPLPFGSGWVVPSPSLLPILRRQDVR